MSRKGDPDRIDGLSREQREALIERLYGRKPEQPDVVMDMIHRAVSHKQGLSLIRVGDVMADLVTGHLASIQIWSFIGIPQPPPQEFLDALIEALQSADILGLTHRMPHARWFEAFLRREQIRPPYVADSFLNDALLANGAISELFNRYRVGLVGRSAEAAARQLAAQGLHVAVTASLDDWNDYSSVCQTLFRSASTWDVLLVGAGESGRILCARLARQASKVALDVGHVLDGLAYPDLWEKANRRLLYRRMYIQKKRIR